MLRQAEAGEEFTITVAGRPVARPATANVHNVALLTADVADLAIIDDLVRVQALR